MMSPLLKTRPEGCLSDLVLDRILAVEQHGSLEEAQAHLATCAACSQRFEALRRDRDTFLASGATLGSPKAAPNLFRRVRPLGIASLGALAAAAAGLLFMHVKLPDNGSEESTRLKGTSHLGFFVKRGDAVARGATGEVVHAGDALRFVYSTGEPRYLGVLSLDGARHASIYYPNQSSASRIEAASDKPLDSSTVLDETLGQETIFGVFCSQPIALEPLRNMLEASGALPVIDGCQVDSITIRKEPHPLQ